MSVKRSYLYRTNNLQVAGCLKLHEFREGRTEYIRHVENMNRSKPNNHASEKEEKKVRID